MNTETDMIKKDAEEEKLSLGARIISEVKFFTGLAAFMLVFLTFIWGHYKIPSESMLPTLEVGDHIYVAKYAYGYSRHSAPFGLHKLPFLPEGKILSKMPKRGDVAVFRRAKTRPGGELVMIKRIVGLPGDTIRMHRGRLYINNVIVERETVTNYLYRQYPNSSQKRRKQPGTVVGVDVYTEQWPEENQPHRIYEQSDLGPLDNTEEFIVPEGHVFFMGDNRDNSTDSRAVLGPSYVPLDHLIGRADLMMFSFKRCKTEDELRCPPFRLMKKL